MQPEDFSSVRPPAPRQTRLFVGLLLEDGKRFVYFLSLVKYEPVFSTLRAIFVGVLWFHFAQIGTVTHRVLTHTSSCHNGPHGYAHLQPGVQLWLILESVRLA